ncbi:DEAD-box type RNA helicase [Xylographa carneopallida]|nr:DEAD-box type RNA helicase [Xylographa carneopallida]
MDVWMLQGPPGTGKTSTIVALASALLGLPPQEAPAACSKAPKGPKEASLSPRRILVCAQSNAAVDELTLRLSKGVLDRDTGTEREARLVRVGVMMSMDAGVKALHIDALCEQRLKTDKDLLQTQGAAEAARKQFRELKEEMKQVHDRLALVRDRSRSRTATPDPAATASGAAWTHMLANLYQTSTGLSWAA